MIEFSEVDGESAVYTVSMEGRVHPTAIPANAKSRFSEDYDVAYNDCRAKVVEYLGYKFVVVGEVA